MEEDKSVFTIWIGKPTRRIPLGRPTCRWENNIRMGLKEVGVNTRNWIGLIRDRDYWRTLVNAELNLRVPFAMELVRKRDILVLVLRIEELRFQKTD